MPATNAARAPGRTSSARHPCSTKPRPQAESDQETQPMSKAKPGKPSIATYADHEVITPPNRLRGAVSTVRALNPADDPVARAERALAQLSGEFSSWMDEECERLSAARAVVKAKGFNKA